MTSYSLAICLIEPDNDFRQRKRPIKANLQDPFAVCTVSMSRTQRNEIDAARCDQKDEALRTLRRSRVEGYRINVKNLLQSKDIEVEILFLTTYKFRNYFWGNMYEYYIKLTHRLIDLEVYNRHYIYLPIACSVVQMQCHTKLLQTISVCYI